LDILIGKRNGAVFAVNFKAGKNGIFGRNFTTRCE
jgi:hypothetical protein